MKKLVIILFLSIIGAYAYSQSWVGSSNRLLSDSEVVLIDSDIDNNSSVVVYGYFTGTLRASSGESITSNGARDYFIAKFDSLSAIDWMYNLGSTGNDYVDGGMAVNEDGSIYLTGGFRNDFYYTPIDFISSTGGFDTFILKYDTDGNVVWIKHSGQGPLNQRPNALETDQDSNILVGGFFTDSISFDGEGAFKSENTIDDFYYAKFSSIDGSFIWAKRLIGIDNIASGRIVSISAGTETYLLVGLFSDSIGFASDTLVTLDGSNDLFILNTDSDGNENWIRQISGSLSEYSYSANVDNDGAWYVGGYFNSNPMFIDSTDTEQVLYNNNYGGFDLMIMKYSGDGILQWINSTGGKVTDKVWDIDIQAKNAMITGSFTETLSWGVDELSTVGGGADVDMIIGTLDEDGGFYGANSFGGRFNSREEGRAIFESNGKTYAVIRSDADLLVLGDSSYVAPGGVYYIVFGEIGCKPINFEYVEPVDLTCYNDHSGSLVVIASGGFGGPYRYSMDGGETYFSNSGLFEDLPAGNYQIKVKDKENCSATGPSGTISQPDSIQFSYTMTHPLCADSLYGSIEFSTPMGGSNEGWEFSIDSGATYQSMKLFSGISIDDYYLIVKDDNECKSVIIDTTLFTPIPITYDFDLAKDSIACYGDSDGEIHFKNVSGGTGIYQYTIDNFSFIVDTFFLNLGGGNYSLAVRDENNCLSMIIDTSIYEPEELMLSLLDSANIMGDTDGFIEVEATGGTLPYTYRIQETGAEMETSVAHAFIFAKGEEGTYTVEATDGNNCGPVAISSIEIVYFPGVGIDNSDLIEANVYPSPTSGEINIEMKFEASQATIEVLNLAGQIVHSRVVYPSGGMIRETLSLEDLASGMYMMRIDGKMLRSSIMLQ